MRGLPLLGTLRVLRTPQLIADPSDFPDKLFPLCVHTYSACRNRVYVVRACNLNIPSGRDATNIHHAPSKGLLPPMTSPGSVMPSSLSLRYHSCDLLTIQCACGAEGLHWQSIHSYFRSKPSKTGQQPGS